MASHPRTTVSARLPISRLLAYGSLGIPTYMVMMPLVVYLPPFYAQELGLSLATIGTIFFVARVWDGLSDLLVGALSDRTRHAWGRRKIWIAAGAPLLVAAMYFLCRPPAGASANYLATWLVLFYMAWTMVQVPYLSWGAELSQDYHERSRITAWREGGGLVGMLLATGGPYLLFGEGVLSLKAVLGLFLVAVVVLVPLTGGAALTLVQDRGGQTENSQGLREILRILASNKPFQRLIAALLLMRTGACVFDATEVWLLSDWCKLPHILLLVIFLQYVFSVLSIPLVLKVARAVGKHRALTIAIFANLTFLAILAYASAGSRWLVIAAYVINAVGNAANWVIPTSMVADTVDYGELKGARGQSGTYMAIYTMAFKLSLALGVIIALPLLELAGFSPTHPNPGHALSVLVLVACALPALLEIPALSLLWNFPIDERRHNLIRRWIETRARRRGSHPEPRRESLSEFATAARPGET